MSVHLMGGETITVDMERRPASCAVSVRSILSLTPSISLSQVN